MQIRAVLVFGPPARAHSRRGGPSLPASNPDTHFSLLVNVLWGICPDGRTFLCVKELFRQIVFLLVILSAPGNSSTETASPVTLILFKPNLPEISDHPLALASTAAYPTPSFGCTLSHDDAAFPRVIRVYRCACLTATLHPHTAAFSA